MEGEVILVAVDASKKITGYALEWSVRNVAKTSDSLILLAFVPSQTCSQTSPNIRARQSQFFSCLLKKFGIDCRKEGSSRDDSALINGVDHNIFHRVNDAYLNMMQELCSTNDLMQVQTEVKVVVDLQPGSVASNAKELQANWVILDRNLKRESEYCLKQLKCNIVLVDHTITKVLKVVNLPIDKSLKRHGRLNDETKTVNLRLRNVSQDCVSTATNRGSIDTASPIFDTDVPFSISSPSTSNIISRKKSVDLDSQYFSEKVEAQVVARESNFQSKLLISSKSHPKFSANPLYDMSSFKGTSKTAMKEAYSTIKQNASIPPRRSTELIKLRQNDHESSNCSKNLTSKTDSLTINKDEIPIELSSPTMNRTSSVRKAMSLFIKQPPNPPPLCSICKHNAPIFGKAPRKFSFKEIEIATNRFSSKNFLAEGGFGPVHKGVLSNGQLVAVKQHKMLSAQGASEFCSEVEVLSCAQHRNLVMLVGYCVETEWILVYEFACNGSLDKHLYGTRRKESMSWKNRMKVAIGSARGLRYLHEDCRVGCIVHRDFRPNNILLTHDFEPMVGDFGLARWQVDGQSAEETRVIGALGYLAPEYTLSGLITEKADVYAFGVVLLELLSGFNVTEFSRKTGQQFVSEWGSPLLESMNIDKIIDPLLENNYVKKEVECMMVSARLCISLNPDQRPNMSKVLKVLEGDVLTDIASDNKKRSSVSSSRNSSLSRLSNPMESEKRSACGEKKESDTTKLVNETLSEVKASEVKASEEYQAYLRDSLAKFFQKLDGN